MTRAPAGASARGRGGARGTTAPARSTLRNQLGDEVSPLAKAVAENGARAGPAEHRSATRRGRARVRDARQPPPAQPRALGQPRDRRGGAGLTTAQRENPRLEHLGLENNRMDVKGRVEMLESLADNQRSRDRAAPPPQASAARKARPRRARPAT